MAPNIILAFAATSALYFARLATCNPLAPAITAAPRFVPRSGGGTDWIGYYWTTASDGSSSIAESACGSGRTLTTSGNFVNCCGVDPSDTADICSTRLVTGCSGDYALYAIGSSTSCNLCNTDTIFSYSTPDASAKFWVGCNSQGSRIFFGQMPPEAAASTTRASSGSSSIASSSTVSPGSTASGPAATVSGGAASASSNAPPPTENKSSGSKAWIAGVVVGAVALIALAILAFWLIRRRKNNKEQAYQPAPQTSQAYPQPGYAPPPNGAQPYHDATSPQDPRTSYMSPTADQGAWKPQVQPYNVGYMNQMGAPPPGVQAQTYSPAAGPAQPYPSTSPQPQQAHAHYAPPSELPEMAGSPAAGAK